MEFSPLLFISNPLKSPDDCSYEIVSRSRPP
jgi:hypothetical protein